MYVVDTRIFPTPRGTFYYLRFITCNPYTHAAAGRGPHYDILYIMQQCVYMPDKLRHTKAHGKFMFNVNLWHNEIFLYANSEFFVLSFLYIVCIKKMTF